jgi:cobalamin biosynthesis protein CobT
MLIGDVSMKKVKLDKDKFKKVLAKTGSTIDHEALAFTRKANAMLKENSMTWEDVELYIKDNEIIISNVQTHTYTESTTSRPFENASSGTSERDKKTEKTDEKKTEKTEEKKTEKTEEKKTEKTEEKKTEKTEEKYTDEKTADTDKPDDKKKREKTPEEPKQKRIKARILSPSTRIIDLNLGMMWLCIDCKTINHFGEVCSKCKEYIPFDSDEVEWEDISGDYHE